MNLLTLLFLFYLCLSQSVYFAEEKRALNLYRTGLVESNS